MSEFDSVIPLLQQRIREIEGSVIVLRDQVAALEAESQRLCRAIEILNGTTALTGAAPSGATVIFDRPPTMEQLILQSVQAKHGKSTLASIESDLIKKRGAVNNASLRTTLTKLKSEGRLVHDRVAGIYSLPAALPQPSTPAAETHEPAAAEPAPSVTPTKHAIIVEAIHQMERAGTTLTAKAIQKHLTPNAYGVTITSGNVYLTIGRMIKHHQLMQDNGEYTLINTAAPSNGVALPAVPLKHRIVAAIKELNTEGRGPKTAELVAHLGPKVSRQSVYNELLQLKNEGRVLLDNSGLHLSGN